MTRQPRRPGSIAIWTLAILLALSFAAAAWPKLLMQAGMVRRFDAWGYPSWVVLMVGLLELAGALLVLVPRWSALGATLISAVMLGAVYTHLASGIGSPSMALIYLAMAAVLLWLRTRQAMAHQPRHRAPGA